MSDGLALSALDWWSEAGVDTLVDDRPRNWLDDAAPADAPAIAAPAARPPAPALPADLAAFRLWLCTDPAVPGPAAARFDAAGDPASGTMVIVDMPEDGDRAAGALLAGDAGALFDKMLAAMSLDRATIYLAALAQARPASGRIAPADGDLLARLMRHHVALAAPRRLLLLGDAPATALAGYALAEARGQTRSIAHDGGAVPAIVSFHPRFLLRNPKYKSAAWADLQSFMVL